jgi:DNA polymerase-3 subunit delta
MTPEQFRKAIAKGALAPAYFFSGPEAGQMKEALDALAGTVPEAVRAFNHQVFYAFEADFAEVMTAARTMPFMAPRRVVVLRDVEKTRLDQAGRAEMLDEYLAAPPPETILVVTTEDDAKAKSLGRQYGERWVHVQFRALEGEALEKILREEGARLGLRLAHGALVALVAATGADLGRARNELAKLRAALGDGGVVDEAAVARYAAGYEHHGTKDITEAIGERDLAAALRLLREVTIKDEEFLGLLGMIGKRLRVLWHLAGGEREAPKEYRLYPSEMGRLRAAARRFTREELEGGLEGLRALDDRVKSTQVPPKLLLEHYLIGFLSR